MMDWDKLRIFHAVAEAGSFTHAGETLNLSQSAVSRQISSLEESLNVSLFHRHARGLILTEQGELLYRTSHEVFSKLAMAEAQLAESKDRPKGQLKVTATQAFGSSWLTPVLGEFIEHYPDVQVDLVLEDRELDLSMREADVAIRMQPPRQPELIQRHLMTVHLGCYASPTYIKRHGIPKTPDELDQHRIIVYGEDTTKPPVQNIDWLLRAGSKKDHQRKPILRVKQHLCDPARRPERIGPRFAAGIHGAGIRCAGARAARIAGPAHRRLFRLSGRAAQFKAHPGLPRLPAAQGRRKQDGELRTPAGRPRCNSALVDRSTNPRMLYRPSVHLGGIEHATDERRGYFDATRASDDPDAHACDRRLLSRAEDRRQPMAVADPAADSVRQLFHVLGLRLPGGGAHPRSPQRDR
jgi:molybdenum-dependent DNA-binding transcriptional regulator ModE